MSPAMNWLQEGRDVGATLDACHAIVVVGSDPSATAQVALGIARVQAEHRRVAVGDMFGDAPPLHALVDSEDEHGLMDAFYYGVSLNKIAHAVKDAEQLFVMPSGTGPLDYADLFVHPRWRRLAAGFREVGALLVIAAPAEAAHVHELVSAMDGAVLVGDTVPMDLPVALSLAWVRPRRSAIIPAPGLVPPAQATPAGVTSTALPPDRRRLGAALGGVGIAALLVGAFLWLSERPFAEVSRIWRGVNADSPAAVAITGGTVGTDSALRARRDSAARDSLSRFANETRRADSIAGVLVANPGDSASASAFALRFESTMTSGGAILYLAQRYKGVPAGTYAIEPRTGLYLITVGAYPSRAGADSLFQELQAKGMISPGVGGIVSAPFAFLIQANLSLGDAAARRAPLVKSGKPVYALRQTDGTANLYFGAFESPQQAAFALPLAKSVTPTPTLVYRIGRVY